MVVRGPGRRRGGYKSENFLFSHARHLQPSRPLRRRRLLLPSLARLSRSLPLACLALGRRRRPSSSPRARQRRPFALWQQEKNDHRWRFFQSRSSSTTAFKHHDCLHPDHRHPQRLVPLRRGPRRRAPQAHRGLRRRQCRPLEEPGDSRQVRRRDRRRRRLRPGAQPLRPPPEGVHRRVWPRYVRRYIFSSLFGGERGGDCKAVARALLFSETFFSSLRHSSLSSPSFSFSTPSTAPPPQQASTPASPPRASSTSTLAARSSPSSWPSSPPRGPRGRQEEVQRAAETLPSRRQCLRTTTSRLCFSLSTRTSWRPSTRSTTASTSTRTPGSRGISRRPTCLRAWGGSTPM